MIATPAVNRASRDVLDEALRVLGVRNLVLAIHDASFPSEPMEDVGRGSPYSQGAARLLSFARALGFTGVQLGPQGMTSETNASPYDGTVFSKNTLSLAVAPLVDQGLVRADTLRAIVDGKPQSPADRVTYRYTFLAQKRVLEEAFLAFESTRSPELVARFGEFKQRHASWLQRDALYEPLGDIHGESHWRRWGSVVDRHLWSPEPGEEPMVSKRRDEVRAQHAPAIERYAFGQFLVHAQHDALRARTTRLGLKLFGDLQVGFSEIDVWGHRDVFLRTYLMGAPPSRTHPEGQAWNYPVLDPVQVFDEQGNARKLIAARMTKMLGEFDGVRIDHPHGLVCPWVYRPDPNDPLTAVRAGARLLSSPDLPDHPELARYSIPRRDQLSSDPSTPRWADDWITTLEPAQVARYGTTFDTIVEAARINGRTTDDLVCEVLSTLPHQLRRVLERFGLGRFRVTQKANLDDPKDVYRSENAAPEDWIMLGNHDTKPIWLVVDTWSDAGSLAAHARYLAERLEPEPSARPALVERLSRDRHALAQAKFADLFASRASNVMIFFADLFGLRAVYNSPGTVDEANWRLRLASDWLGEYERRREAGDALDLPSALATAIRARGPSVAAAHRALLSQLDDLARVEPLPLSNR
jgi:4-alpha-glucanotransferase